MNIPLADAGATALAFTQSLVLLDFLLVNDGSSDDTLAVLKRDFDLVSVRPIFRLGVPAQVVRGIYRSRTSARSQRRSSH